MFKSIPGNHNYIISLTGDIRTSKGLMPDLKRNGNKVVIELYGKVESVDVIWLALIANFEVDLPDRYKTIVFPEANPKSFYTNSGRMMRFLVPVLIDGKYRIIPNYPQYAISKTGKIITVKSKTEVDVHIGRNKYPVARVYDPDQNRFRDVLLHRLVALAWCTNDDYVTKPIVNHIDGNKLNYHYKNLEWVSYSDNTKHALATGLMIRPGRRNFKVKDLSTGVIREFDSASELIKGLGIEEVDRRKIRTYRTRATIILDRYEVKDLSDDSPWSDEGGVVKKNKHTILITYPDGTKETFSDNLSLMRKFKVWNISYNVREIARVILEKNPDLKVDIIENHSSKPVEALNIATGEVVEADTIRRMALLTHTTFSTIQQAITRNDSYVRNGYVFRYKSDKAWPQDYKRNPNAPKLIRAKNLETNEEIIFPSLKHVYDRFRVSRFILHTRMNEGRPIKGWMLSEVI